MTQFVAYKNQNPDSKASYPYLLDIQSDFLIELQTTVVLPLSPEQLASDIALSRLNPAVEIDNQIFIVMTQDIAGIARRDLTIEVCDLGQHRQLITAAIDFLIAGI
jgi:toxin CcdB